MNSTLFWKLISQDYLFTFQYLEAVQDLSGYQTVAFPPCTCSVRNNGFVIPRITYDHLELTACSSNGIQEVRVNFSRIFSTALIFTELFPVTEYQNFFWLGISRATFFTWGWLNCDSVSIWFGKREKRASYHTFTHCLREF